MKTVTKVVFSAIYLLVWAFFSLFITATLISFTESMNDVAFYLILSVLLLAELVISIVTYDMIARLFKN